MDSRGSCAQKYAELLARQKKNIKSNQSFFNTSKAASDRKSRASNTITSGMFSFLNKSAVEVKPVNSEPKSVQEETDAKFDVAPADLVRQPFTRNSMRDLRNTIQGLGNPDGAEKDDDEEVTRSPSESHLTTLQLMQELNAEVSFPEIINFIAEMFAKGTKVDTIREVSAAGVYLRSTLLLVHVHRRSRSRCIYENCRGRSRSASHVFCNSS